MRQNVAFSKVTEFNIRENGLVKEKRETHLIRVLFWADRSQASAAWPWICSILSHKEVDLLPLVLSESIYDDGL